MNLYRTSSILTLAITALVIFHLHWKADGMMQEWQDLNPSFCEFIQIHSYVIIILVTGQLYCDIIPLIIIITRCGMFILYHFAYSADSLQETEFIVEETKVCKNISNF
jgi:hypothetical protein